MADWRTVNVDDWEDLNPDSAMRSFGKAKNYTAFVWVLDKDANKSMLFCQPANEYHGDGFESSDLQKSKIYQDKNAVALVGRFGDAKIERSSLVRNPDNHPEGGAINQHPEGGFITLWNIARDQPGKTYGFNNANVEETKVFLQSLLGKFPMKVIGNSPAKLPINESYVLKANYPPIKQTVGGFLKSGDKQEEEDPDCAGIAVNVQGQRTPIAQVLGQLHMVRGQQLELLKGAFCSQYSALKNDNNTFHCKLQRKQMDDIAQTLQCTGGADEFNRYKNAGRFARRQELKNIFSNPHKIGQEFRTQKDVDAAWDELQNKKESLDFRQWVKNEHQRMEGR